MTSSRRPAACTSRTANELEALYLFSTQNNLTLGCQEQGEHQSHGAKCGETHEAGEHPLIVTSTIVVACVPADG